jgi:DNA-binding NarL/FixJ family response regulator
MTPIRVLLVDDNVLFLRAASNFVAQAGLLVVGCARSSCEAEEQVAHLKPDLVLMDIAMPGMPGVNGLEATRHLKAQPDPPRVIILTLYDNPAYVTEAQVVGADDLVPKAEMGVKLLPAIQTLFTATIPDRK